jgi:hypothetical protein
VFTTSLDFQRQSAQAILRKISKIDLEQAATLVENQMRAAIMEGDKLSLAQSRVDAVSAQMQQNLNKII